MVKLRRSFGHPGSRKSQCPAEKTLAKACLHHNLNRNKKGRKGRKGKRGKGQVRSKYSQFRLYGLRICGLFGHIVIFLLVLFVNGY